jgi:hypothetical protein
MVFSYGFKDQVVLEFRLEEVVDFIVGVLDPNRV